MLTLICPVWVTQVFIYVVGVVLWFTFGFMKYILLLLFILFNLGCVKKETCIVKSITTINEYRLDSIFVNREYLVQLDCDL